ncbi:two-component system response regulator DctR [Aminivibrio pyruvatiphilus]|jgi:response regulator of citrate/malate metabolism|uniref:Transcriptional regulatory protein n=1 Tax=Aminivibrio pyruvatiphilus TaxID=1005740 RepID=A0A4R8MBG0_9BACT|nr:response regulator [Aminivibrio pyruvatiphilus]TDY63043.1 two-component system response regulator DctR [Aminivibrio pyruvatiphilus]
MDLQLPVRVLIAEDDPMVCSLHVQAVRQLSGFAVAGTVSDGFELLEFFKRNTADLIVMDIFMPRLSGLEALKRLRSRGNTSDVILVSAGKKADLVSRARTLGAFDYMIKPYSLQRFRASLENYMEHRMRLRAVRDETTQEEVDAFFEIGHRSSGPAGEEEVLPKGFQKETLALVAGTLGESGSPTALELGDRLSISRSTARRYLEYLAEKGLAEISFEYRTSGRPLKRYTTPGKK